MNAPSRLMSSTATDPTDRPASPALPPTLFRLPDRRRQPISDASDPPNPVIDPSSPITDVVTRGESSFDRMMAATAGMASSPSIAAAKTAVPTSPPFPSSNIEPLPASGKPAPKFDELDRDEAFEIDRETTTPTRNVPRPSAGFVTTAVSTLSGVVLANKTIIGLLLVVVGAGWYSGRKNRAPSGLSGPAGSQTAIADVQFDSSPPPPTAPNRVANTSNPANLVVSADGVPTTAPPKIHPPTTGTPIDPSIAIARSMAKLDPSLAASPPTDPPPVSTEPAPVQSPDSRFAALPTPETDPSAGQILSNPFVQNSGSTIVQTAGRSWSAGSVTPATATLPTGSRNQFDTGPLGGGPLGGGPLGGGLSNTGGVVPVRAGVGPPSNSPPYRLSRTPAGISDWRAYLPTTP